MKITAITAQNFLGVRNAELQLRKLVTLVAGDNYAGKSSLQEGLRMALVGESVRVALKKEYAQLVSEGAESGFVAVDTDLGEASIVLPKGTHTAPTFPPALPYVLDAQRFAKMDDKDRRSFLFGLMNVQAGGAAVKERLLKRGCAPAKVEAVMPLLRAGFPAACEEAKTKATAAKTAWRTITGETYGAKKAEGWRADAGMTVDPGDLERAQTDYAALERDIEATAQQFGEQQARGKAAGEKAQKATALREQVEKRPRIVAKLERDRRERDEWKEKVLVGRAYAKTAAQSMSCPCCGEALRMGENGLEKYERQPGDDAAAEFADKLGDHEKALTLLENSVANGERDLALCDQAKAALDALEAAVGEGVDTEELEALEAAVGEGVDTEELEALPKKLETLRANKKAAADKIEGIRADQRKAAEAETKTKKAAEHHADVAAWDLIGDALAPDGIPGELLAEALTPINDRLTASALFAEWPRIEILPDMTIRAALHERPYALLSESEKWRADAMIAEAIAFLSGVKVLVLDRFDVLNGKGREDLLVWLDDLAGAGELDSALVFGTLKALPSGLPANVDAVWIENGVVGAMREAA